MKPLSAPSFDFLSDLLDTLSSIKKGVGSVSVSGFHFSLIPFLLGRSDFRFVFYFEETNLGSALEGLGLLLENRVGLYVPPLQGGDVPPGFEGGALGLQSGAIASIVSGLESFRFVVTEKSVKDSFCVLPTGSSGGCRINGSTSYRELVDVLSRLGYVSVDVVVDPGTFSARGGIVDLFVFSMPAPVRVNFFDSTTTLSYFNKDTQITTKKISSVVLVSLPENDSNKRVFSDVVKKDYLSVSFSNDEALFGVGDRVGDVSVPVKIVSYEECKKHVSSGGSFFEAPDLITNGVLYKENLLLPPYFLRRNPSYHPGGVGVFDWGVGLEGCGVGDFLVHRHYGVGIFKGLKLSLVGDEMREFLVIEYKDGGLVSVSNENMTLVSYFAPKFEPNIQLGSLNRPAAWNRRLSSVKKDIDIVVDSLVLSMSERKSIKRESYFVENLVISAFLDAFPHTETHDQSRAWEDIFLDLQSLNPMDRLLCGDVGFGKTEVAMRAAFVVSYCEKQVAVLAPTTILALQLYNSFLERFSGSPQKINLFTRLQNKNAINKTKQGLKSGDINIVIGTHKLLSSEVSFAELGLIIVDEEHRFGVKQKEKIKLISKEVDVLFMSATPIPRTMQLSISGIKAISTIFTPPPKRRPISTSVKYSNDVVLRETITREIRRDGQVYVVNNNVNNLLLYTEKLRLLVPFASFDFIHGQEPVVNIETKMSAFINKKIDVLVCSSIIEAGIDVPGVNTIIIENSHLFGLAQLYQLRGRVGRSGVGSFAVLLIPKNHRLSGVAKKRLKTIQDNTSLGSGYKIANIDLEMRGSGSLFGYKQSGSYGYLGKELYQVLVDETLCRAAGPPVGFVLPIKEVQIKIIKDCYIPDEYISNQFLRFDLYKKIFSAQKNSDLVNIEGSIKNRHGPIPDTMKALFYTQRARILCAMVGVVRASQSENSLFLVFADTALALDVLIKNIGRYLENNNNKFSFSNNNKNNLVLKINLSNIDDSCTFLMNFLNKLRK